MYILKVRNKYDEMLELTNNPAYEISSIDGFDPPEATINTSKNANYDGEVYNSSFMNSRQVTITMAINGPAETNRINLYRYFKSKSPVRLFYKTESRDVYIDGYVKSMQIGFFEKKQTVQIVVECPRPQLNGSAEDIQEFSSIESLFEFPFSIEEAGVPFSNIILAQEKSIINHGDLETGVKIKIRAMGHIVTPKIFNVETAERIVLNTTLEPADEVDINTIQGEKEITLTRNGVVTNLIGALDFSSTWIQMQPGDNVFTVAADSGAEYLQVTFTMVNQFEGV